MKRIHILKNFKCLVLSLLLVILLLALDFYAAEYDYRVHNKLIEGSKVLYLTGLNDMRNPEAEVIIENLENRMTEVFLKAFDREGNSIQLPQYSFQVEAENTASLHLASLPVEIATLKLSSEKIIYVAAGFMRTNCITPVKIPALKDSSQVLDFPPLFPGDAFYKKIILLNPGITPTGFQIIGIDEKGLELGRAFSGCLKPMESQAFLLKDIFDHNLWENIAAVRIESEIDISGIQVVDDSKKGILSLPAIIRGSKYWAIPMEIGKDELGASIGIYNPGAAYNMVSIKTYDRNYYPLGFSKEIELAPREVYFLTTQSISGLLPDNVSFVEISANESVATYKVMVEKRSNQYLKVSLGKQKNAPPLGERNLFETNTGLENRVENPQNQTPTDSISTTAVQLYDTAWSFRYPLATMPGKTQAFGVWNSQFNGYHLGEDYVTSAEVAVYAIGNGRVMHVQSHTSYGYVVVIEHLLPDNTKICSVYGHLRYAGLIPVNTNVTKGQRIGYLSGNKLENGGYNFIHLHWGIRKDQYSTALDSDGKFRYRGYGPQTIKSLWHTPSTFVSLRSKGLVVTNLQISPATPETGKTFNIYATINNQYYYGGTFNFRARIIGKNGYSGSCTPISKWLNPGNSVSLTWSTYLNSAGDYDLILEFLAPGTSKWWELARKPFKVINGSQKNLTSISVIGPSYINENSYSYYTTTAYYSDGSTENVTNTATWSENSSYAYFDSSQKGKLITTSISADTSAAITVSYTYNGVTMTASKYITIKNVEPVKTLTSVSISGPSTVQENSYGYYTATAYYSDGSTENVTNTATWSENSSHAYFDSSQKGKFITTSVSSDTSVTITASYTYNGITKTASQFITIKNTEPVKTLTSVSVSGPSTVQENSYGYYTAYAYYSDGSTENVTNTATWSENSSYAYFDSSQKGKLLTTSVSTDTNATITASYTYNGVTKSGSMSITIKNNAPTYSINTSVTTNGGGTWGSIFKETASISGTYLTLTVQKIDGSAWTSSGTVYFKVGTYEPYGVNRAQYTAYVGATSFSYTHNLLDYQGQYPKSFYVRYEANIGGFAWVGPITVTENTN